MKKALVLLVLVSVVALFAGCAGVISPGVGTIYTDAQAPLMVTSNDLGATSGKGEVQSILGIICTGDVSINKIATEAGIKKVSHVDYHVTNFLGVFAKLVVTVYGQ